MDLSILVPYRNRLDELDRRIVALLAERIDIICEVGVVKYREGIPATLPDRVAQVIDQAAAAAEDRGIDPVLVRGLYTDLVAYCCRLEEDIAAELTATRKAVGE